MTSLSSILSSSLTTKDPMKTDVVRVSLKSPESSRKAQCDMCKLSYSSQKELLEHCLSLMHHTKLEDRAENSSHECVLCSVTCSNMTDYRRHIITDIHQKKLCGLKGDQEQKINRSDGRENMQESRYSFLSNSGYGSTTFSSANTKFQKDADFPEKEIPNTLNKLTSQLGRHDNRDSNFRYDEALDAQMWNKGSWPGNDPNRNDMYHWSRDACLDQEYGMETGDKEHLKSQQEQQKSYEQSSNVSSGYYDYNSNGGYARPWRYENSQDWMRMNNVYQNNGLEQTLEGASEIDFTSDVLPTDWDEKSLLENEQFLAGIDGGYQSGKQQSHQESNAAGIGRWYEANFRDRKRPLNEGDIQESFAKSPRSIDSSSDDSIPVRDVPKRRVPLYETPSVNKSTLTTTAPTSIKALSKVTTIDDASNNILERAERLCKELREKREASQVQRNHLLKKQEHESLNQRMSALVEKQQIYLKGHITSSKKHQEEESYDSGSKKHQEAESYDSGYSLGRQLKQNGKLATPISRKSSIGSGASGSPPRTPGKTLKDTNKTTEESVLEGQGNLQSSMKNSPLLRKTLKSIIREDAKFGKNGESKDLNVGIINKPLSKLAASKPHLSKDSLKKMVNAPNSRDKRLQLVKMLQSREEQKAAATCASRTGLQLEGSYDSVFDSKELNMDENCSSQSVNLEDLSVNVRQQILDLISRDVSPQSICQPQTGRTSPSRPPKKTSTSLTDVIVLSDDEDLKDARKNKKNSSKKLSSLNSAVVKNYVVKTDKKKKTLTGPAKGVLKNSVVSSMTSPSVLKHSVVSSMSSPSVLKNSVVSSMTSPSVLKHSVVSSMSSPSVLKHSVVSSMSSKSVPKPLQYVNHSGNLRPSSPIHQVTKAYNNSHTHTDNDIITVSNSTENKLGNKRNTFLRDNISQDSPGTVLVNKKNLSISSAKNTHKNSSYNTIRSLLSSCQIQGQLNSANVVDKFPTLLNTCKADRILTLKGNERTVLSDSEVSNRTSEQAHSAPDKSSDKQQQASSSLQTFTPMSSKLDVRSSVAQTIQGTTFSETAAHGWSSSQIPTSQSYKSDMPALSPGTLLTNRTSSPHTSQAYKSDTPALSSGSLLTNRTSSPHIYEKHHTSSSDISIGISPTSLMSTTPMLTSSFKDLPNKDATSADLLLNDVDHRKADFPDVRMKSASPVIIDGSSSQTMSKLLVLSEKEEHVKQEKMTMDLRLSRLHRLLEQAVVQINMCTDRMNQLHEEEKDMLKKRLSLLRVATSVKPSRRPGDAPPENESSFPAKSSSHDYSQAAETGLCSFSNPNTGEGVSSSSPMSTSTSAPLDITSLDKTENHQGTLSRSDWLAKFSSYLPKDPVTEANKTTARSFSLSTSSAGLNPVTNCSTNSLNLDSTLTSQSFPNSHLLNPHFPEKDISSQQIIDLEMRNQEMQEKHSLKSGLYDKLSQVSSSELAGNNSRQNIELQAHSHSAGTSGATSSAAKIGEPPSHSLLSVPIMYVGSFRSTDGPMRLIDPVVLVRTSDSTLKKPETEFPTHLDQSKNTIVASSSCPESGTLSKYSSSFADLLQLSSPPRSHIMAKSGEHGGEESDIGSVASSIASGSSLGEQITRYCRATPGASLDSREPFEAHELSVILSDASEQMGLDNQDDNGAYIKKKDCYRNVRECSVSLERLDRISRKNVYGSLDEKAVKSAEALHLLERNYENISCPSSIASDIGKRKRRRTKQERDTSEFSRRRHNCIILSSSEEEEEDNGKSMKSLNSDVDASGTQVKGSDESFGQENCRLQKVVNDVAPDCGGLTKLELDSPSKVTVGSNVTMTNIDFTSPSKTASNLDVTFAECDSSTSWDIVDLESVNLRINSLKELGSNFGKKSALFSKSTSPDAFTDVNSAQTDVLFKNGSRLHRPDISSLHSHLDTVKQNSMTDSIKLGSTCTATSTFKPASGPTSYSSGLPSHSTIDLTKESTSPELSSVARRTSAKSTDEINLHDVSTKNKTSSYSCDYGPVVDICVGRGQIYVGHVNRGVRVYNMSGLNQDKCLREYNFPYLQCLSTLAIDGAVTLIIGNGCNLVFCNSNEEEQLKHDLGTTIKCLLSLPPLVYAGLDTGEVCIYDTMRKAIRDRCICSDHPIHCLAAGQEGTIKLLCVSSQDGTIMVVNAQQCLPMRILTGHTKTAFSIQVEGHLVFSGSGDHTVLIQNLHTAAVEHRYRESKGLIKSVCYSQGYLFTGGMDKLVRCYNVKTHQLVQVYYGADRGVITKILVLGDLLITGSISGSVHVVDIDYEARHECHIDGCGLNFGIRSHLSWHLLEDHNISSSSRDCPEVSRLSCA